MADDEARARASLIEMQGLLLQGPHVALGIAEISTPEQVRAAFLTLTKQFHPARFGRLSPDLARMSNEVFLGIKSAHEQMMKALGAPTRPRGSTGGVPVAQPDAAGSSGVPASRQSSPVMRATGQIPPLGRPGQPAGPPQRRTGTTPPPPMAPGSRPMPIVGRPGPSLPPTSTSGSGQMPSAGQPGQPGQPSNRLTPATGVPINRAMGSVAMPRTLTPSRPPLTQRPGTPVAPTSTGPTRPTPSTSQPPTQARPAPSTSNPPNPSHPPTPSNAYRPSSPVLPGQPARQTSQMPPLAASPTAPTFDEEASLAQARQLLSRKDWTAARVALHALAVRVPQSRPYRALLCYARGREAQVVGKADDAATEYGRALALDPELAVAKQALAELKRR